MRKLTFKGFVESYVEELSYSGTTSIRKLVMELEENPRLREPLILHGILSGMPMDIAKKSPEVFNEYILLGKLYKRKTRLRDVWSICRLNTKR